jgi:two-component system, oxyanion-binding sensor
MRRVTAGFLPLLDAAILIAAREKGFAEDQGIELHLVRESSWANIRDRVSVGQFDVAHMLAPLPIAQNLGLSPLSVEMIAPFALGLGGNAITVSQCGTSCCTSAGIPLEMQPPQGMDCVRSSRKTGQRACRPCHLPWCMTIRPILMNCAIGSRQAALTRRLT